MLFTSCLLLSAALAPAASPAVEAKAAMSRLQYLAGTWEGEGWMERGPTRHTFRGREVVQAKLDGVALLVEGNFLSKIGDAEVPVHTTLGVIFHDGETKTYRFHSWLAQGTSGQRELVVESDGWRWEIKGPQGVIRFVMKLTAEGHWLEIGERSSDGQTWAKFFEMTLKKQP
jgi:hypothetical protein